MIIWHFYDFRESSAHLPHLDLDITQIVTRFYDKRGDSSNFPHLPYHFGLGIFLAHLHTGVYVCQFVRYAGAYFSYIVLPLC